MTALKTLLSGLAVAVLAGCANLPQSSGPDRRLEAVNDAGRAQFVLTVANARSSLDGLVDSMLWRGVYGGESARGCARVRLSLADRNNQWHYLVCGQEVLEIMDVAPAPAKDVRIVVALDSLTRAAWRSGRVQRMPHGVFELEAEPVGPPSFGGCRAIDQRLIYQDMLVDVREEKVCGVGR